MKLQPELMVPLLEYWIDTWFQVASNGEIHHVSPPQIQMNRHQTQK